MLPVPIVTRRTQPKDGLSNLLPIGVASRSFSDHGVSKENSEIRFYFLPIKAVFTPAGHRPCSRAHSCPDVHQPTAHHSQVGQRKQRDELCRVFLESAVAHLHKPELALDHPKRMFCLGPNTRLELFGLVGQGVSFCFPCSALCACLGIHANVSLHAEIPLVAFLAGVHLRVTLFIFVLG